MGSHGNNILDGSIFGILHFGYRQVLLPLNGKLSQMAFRVTTMEVYL
ncbi:hypothetical protein HanXRQr2_Chr16g0731381 [Helianthus annuus]|uniref:Uncharacterized protein n=1 Tax=Helianthus annuus TaxID=4232 RepID=A0A9K3DP55_HELAN|nr:hypothetical protein HanXRQr2_Chr16g0731381 [Helianthus annuus]KAJ0436943.1 hypothetical protein HanHA300_Chr16g0596281 [Helianthus annuus]KAJ0459255.1 hypothetical protein HanHA89_Chr16g0646771 [Helianthus annuus]